MWTLIKWLVFIVIITLIFLAVTGQKIGGKTVTDYIKGIVGAKTYDEGVKDMRSLVGEAVKAVGDAISPEPTSAERKELENVIQKELQVPPPTEGAQTAKPEAQAPKGEAKPATPVTGPKKEGGK